MLILFASDLHGKLELYNQLISLVKEKKPSILILGGDLLPKCSSGRDLFKVQRDFIRIELINFFHKLFLLYTSLEVGLMLGNDDFSSLREEFLYLDDKGLFKLIDNQRWTTGSGWHIIGFNLVPETPFALKDFERRDCENTPIHYPAVRSICSVKDSYRFIDAKTWLLSHPSLSEELSRLPQVVKPEKTIFVSHCPPYNTPLDVRLDGKHVGSIAIRRYIKSERPLISLHGHIHESFLMTGKYFTQLGDTICFNPGQIHYPYLDAVLLNTDDPAYNNEHTGRELSVSKESFNLLKAPFVELQSYKRKKK